MIKLRHLLGIMAAVALLVASIDLGMVGAESAGFEWTVPMTADAGAEGSNSDLEFGIHTDATDGYDSGIDVPHPPPGPTPPPFKAYFLIVDMLFPELNKDFRGEIPNQWTLNVYSTTQAIELSWNTAGVPAGVALRLTNGGIDIDMLSQSSTSLPAGSHTLTITATEVIPEYPLTMAVDPAGSGTATDLTNASPYPAGTVVDIEADAASGYQFVNWTAPAGTFGDENAATTTFTMPAEAVTVTANFELIPTYALTMAVAPAGSGTATDVTNASPYPAGTVVNIEASAAAGYQFVNWTAPAGTFGDENAATTTFTMPAEAVTVTANFELIPTYALTMAANPEIGGTATDVTDASPYPAGTVVNIEASAAAGYRFVNWTAPAGTFGDENAATTTFTMPPEAVTVTANFELIPTYALTMAANPEIGGTATDVTDASPYPAGTVVNIEASAAAGYRFVNWTAPAGTFGDENAATTTFTMPAEAVTVTANFRPGVLTSTGTGIAFFTSSQGTIEDLEALPVPPDPPAGITFPHGLFSFRVTGLEPGQTATITIELPTAVPAGTAWWKYHEEEWHDYNVPITIQGNIMTITLTDGGVGDIDGLADGIITDPGGPGYALVPVGGTAYPVSKLPVLLLWSALAAGVIAASLLALRRRRVQT